VVVLIPTLAALAGAAWAASHRSEVVRNGLVVHDASFGDALTTALVGGLVSLVALVALVFAAHLVWYRLIGDRTWKVAWVLHDRQQGPVRTTASGVSLRSRGAPPVSVSTLGHVEAVVRLPSSRFVPMPQHGMGSDPSGLGFAPAFGRPPERGDYEVRWYGTRQSRRLQEVARSKTTFDG
jgi:hypothetical protein